MLATSFKKYSGVNYGPKCPIFVAGDALKCIFIRPHEVFLVINTSVNISQSKLGTLLPHTWRQDSFGGSTSTWYLQVLLRAVLDTSDGEDPDASP